VRRINLALPAAAALVLLLVWTRGSQLAAQDYPLGDSTNYADSAYAAVPFVLASTPSELTALGLKVALPKPAPSSGGSNVGKGALIGGGVGLAIGIGAALAFKNQECDPPDDCGELGTYAPVIAVGITVLGAAIGALVGLSSTTGDSDETTGTDPGDVTLALVSSDRSIGIGASLRF
jgi:hypothetical protein